MKRRDFLAGALGVSAWPLGAIAQVAGRPRRVVVLVDTDDLAQPSFWAAGQGQGIERLRIGLHDLGWINGRNINLEVISAGANPRLFRKYAEAAVAQPADLIWVNNNSLLEEVRKVTGDTVPVVFVLIVDPVRLGYIDGIARPGGNITGFMFWDATLISKWVQLLREAAPSVQRATIIHNPDSTPFYPQLLNEAQAASPIALTLLPLGQVSAIERTMREIAREPGSGLIVPSDPFNLDQRATIATWATAVRMPLISIYPFATSGGSLMGYGPSTDDVQRQSAVYVDRILRGAKPRDLPVQTPTKYEFSINLAVARRLGLQIPPSMFARADEVIE
jgi:putative tryptophan/tyrosine transport system substrate-binding protein